MGKAQIRLLLILFISFIELLETCDELFRTLEPVQQSLKAGLMDNIRGFLEAKEVYNEIKFFSQHFSLICCATKIISAIF